MSMETKRQEPGGVIRALDDGLVLRWAKAGDADALCVFNGNLFKPREQEEPSPWVLDWSAQRGHLMQAITGMGFFYRQFGYELAMDLSGSRQSYAANVSQLPEGKEEPLRIRPATEDDIPFIVERHDAIRDRALWTCVRGEAIWRHEVRRSAELGAVHPVYDACADLMPKVRQPYAWYIRVPDLCAFLQKLTPALERRLGESPLAGHTGAFKISAYAWGIRLDFEQGRLACVEPFQPGDEDEEEDQVRFPYLTFLQVLMGCRTAD